MVSSKYLRQHGDNRLGGDDFDQKVTDYMIADFKKKKALTFPTIRWHCRDSREAAEKAKKELSSSTTTNINLPFITANADWSEAF